MNIETKTGLYTFKGEDIGFSFLTNLSAVNKIKFVNAVTETIVDENYNSVIRDLIFDFQIINIFTDVSLKEIYLSNLPDDVLSKIEELVSETKIVEIVKANMVEGLIQELNKAVDDNIAYRTGIHKSTLTDSLVNLINTFNKKVNEIDTDNFMELVQKLNNMTGDLSTDTILKAYIDSDLYKKKFKNIQQNKRHQNNYQRNGKKIGR